MTTQLIKHDHGQMYRCKIVPVAGPTEYGEWFGTESDVRDALKRIGRDLGKRYYCETKAMTCPQCDASEKAHVICSL
jgi:hypothetical protein